MILEDLDGSSTRATDVSRKIPARGFPVRKSSITTEAAEPCLAWLANFHAAFLMNDPQETINALWPVGTYWHLATRRDEWAAMEEGPLKEAASQIDRRLNACRFQTLVHGDAKLANFCFPHTPGPVAMVDFQYVGGGCGMKDVAYFASSFLDGSECQRQQDRLLDYYFGQLKSAVGIRQDLKINFGKLETEWRELYRFAWADFYRFLAGWSPGHWKMHGYSDQITAEVLREIGSA